MGAPIVLWTSFLKFDEAHHTMASQIIFADNRMRGNHISPFYSRRCLLTGIIIFLSFTAFISDGFVPLRLKVSQFHLNVLKSEYDGTQASQKEAKQQQQQKQKQQRRNKKYKRSGGGIFEQTRRLNQQIVKCESAKDVLNTLTSTKGALTSSAGGGKLNSVNFSTAIHRLARHVSYSNGGDRSDRVSILSDPRFAMFLCSLAEALAGLDCSAKSPKNKKQKLVFNSREMSNIAWALAKMKIAPPQSVSKLQVSATSQKDLIQTASEIRGMIIEVAKVKQQQQQQKQIPSTQNSWIPALSRLCGHILDTISYWALRENSTNCQPQERANLLWALATAQRSDPQVFDAIVLSLLVGVEKQLTQQDDLLGTLRPQEWSNSIWAFATAQATGQGQDRLILFVADILDTQEGFIDKFKPQELSNTAWGVATLLPSKKQEQQQEQQQDAALRIFRHVTRSLIGRANEFKPQELSNAAWAFGTLGFGLASANFEKESYYLDEYIILPSNDPKGDEDLMTRAMDAIVKSALPRLGRFRSQELNNMAWALAKLSKRYKPCDDILEGMGTQLCDQRRRVTSQDISTTLWSLATLDYSNQKLYQALASRLTQVRAWQIKPQELSNTIWAMATANVSPLNIDAFDTTLVPPSERLVRHPIESDPITMCFGIAANELMRRPYEFKSQEIKDVLWSFSKAGLRHPDLFRSVAVHLVGPENNSEEIQQQARGLREFSPQGLGNIAWAIARQAQLSEAVFDRIRNPSISAASSGRLVVYTASYFDMGEVILKRLFAAIAETDLEVYNNLCNLKPQDISNTAWAFAVLGMKHTKFIEAAKIQLLERSRDYMRGKVSQMTSFKGQEIANLVWAFATLNCRFSDILGPITPYLQKMCSDAYGEISTKNIARIFNRQELANIAWSVIVFGKYPRDLMKLLYSGLVGMADDCKHSDPKRYIRNCYGDGGLQRQAIMTLIYTQLAMEMEDPENDLSLPGDFPEGWGESLDSSSQSTCSLTDTSFDLNLRTSKIQKEVSSTFNRIDFDHVEEHVISMIDLVQHYGFQLPTKSSEVLSIDIADADSKIGVDVDGPSHFITIIDETPPAGGQVKIINKKREYQFNWDGRLQEINGPTALKQRLLKNLGWKLIPLPFWEWYNLKGDEVLQEQYCLSLVEKNI